MSLHRFLTRLIWLCVLPPLLLAAYLAVDRVLESQAARDVEAQSIAESFAQSIDNQLNARIGALNMLAHSPDLDDPAHWDSLYLEARGFYQSFGSNVILADAALHMVFNTAKPFGAKLPDLPKVQGRAAAPLALATNLPAVGDRFTGPVSGELMAAVAVPVQRDGEPPLLFVSPMDIRQFQGLLEQRWIPEGWHIVLQDSQGNLLAHRGPTDPDAAQKDHHGGHFMAKLASAPWSVTVRIPLGIYRSPLIKAVSTMMAALLGVAAIGAFGGLVASRRLGKDVASLADRPDSGTQPSNIAEIAAVRRLLDETEAAFQDRALKLGAIIKHSPAVLSVKYPDGRYALANPNLQKIHHLREEEIIGKTDSDLYPEKIARIFQANDALVWQTMTRHSVEEVIPVDGQSRIFTSHIFPVLDDSGDALFLCRISQDITQRKQAEMAAQQNELRYRTLVDQSVDALFVYNEDGRFVEVSRSACDSVGYTKAELLTMSVLDLEQDLDLARIRAVRGQLDAGFPMTLHGHHRRRDGTLFPVEVRVGVLSLDGRRLYIALVRDVTEREQAEERLRQLNQDLEEKVEIRSREVLDLYDRAPCGYHSLDADGVIIRVNKTELEMLGYPREDYVGHHVSEFMTPKSRELFHERFPIFHRLGVLSNVEFDWVSRDGRIIPVLVSSNIIRDAEGHFMSSRSTMIDNRARKAYEQEIEQARRAAEAATSAKSAFLANMSHEIRTPMNAIIGLTHLLRRAAPTPQQRERLSKIDMAGRHLLSIINDILDISKIEAGRIQLEATDFHLSAILDHVHSLVAEQAQAKGLSVTVDPDHVPIWLRGDPTRLRQALLNYASNAIKFTDSGAITIRALLVEDAGDDMLVRFEVEDTGLGIAAEDVPKLFCSFEQADVSTTRKFGGTGLGLAITRRLATLMGGEAGVVSAPGEGSRFWFTARIGRGHGIMSISQADHETNAETRLRLEHAGARILLADDNVINREVALELLHGVGLNVDVAVNGRDAVDKLRSHAYALVLMDMSMPEMDGIEATKAIRALSGGEVLPILAMTANAFDEDRQACLDAGMDDFVPKPVDPDELFAKILAWLPCPAIDMAAPAEPGLPATGDLRERLAALPGLDAAIGFKVLRGRADSYYALLCKLADGHPSALSTLQACRAAGDMEELSRLAHALKGAAGTLGAVLIASRATALNDAFHSGQPLSEIERLAEDLDIAQSQLADALHKIPDHL